MPVNGFSVGKDISLVATSPAGNIEISGITDFSSKPMQTDIKSKRLDGKTYFGQIPDGWSGSFKIDRMGPNIETFFAGLESGYYAGLNNPSGTIQETIIEADGSISTWRYDGVIYKLDDAGNWAGDKKVEISISFNATTRVRVS